MSEVVRVVKAMRMMPGRTKQTRTRSQLFLWWFQVEIALPLSRPDCVISTFRPFLFSESERFLIPCWGVVYQNNRLYRTREAFRL